MTLGHGGGDFYTMHYFLEKILGRSGGEECIDVYQALDMGITGILAYRSILNGNIPMEVPDFRNPVNREKYRDDHYSTNPNAPEKYRIPLCSFGSPEIPDSVFDEVRKKWLIEQENE
jgi:hypothetical protein